MRKLGAALFALLALLAFCAVARAQVSVTPGAFLDSSAWTAYTVNLSCSSGAFTAATATGLSKTQGKTIQVRVQVTVTTHNTCTFIKFSLPVAAVTSFDQILSGVATKNGKMARGQIGSGTSNATVAFADATDPTVTDGTVLVFSGSYESN